MKSLKITLISVFFVTCTLSTASQTAFLEWPLEASEDYEHCDFTVITNYVEIEEDVDWGGGPVTVDYVGSWLHAGTDISIWPDAFPIFLNDQVSILAAADGIITEIVDGNIDSCLTSEQIEEIDETGGEFPDANFVRIVHNINGEEYRTTYLHLKLGSVPEGFYEGQEIGAGEVIGNPGVSGITTGIHLHFAVQKKAVSGVWKNVDPYSENLWLNPKPYFDKHINRTEVSDSYLQEAETDELNCASFDEYNWNINKCFHLAYSKELNMKGDPDIFPPLFANVAGTHFQKKDWIRYEVKYDNFNYEFMNHASDPFDADFVKTFCYKDLLPQHLDEEEVWNFESEWSYGEGWHLSAEYMEGGIFGQPLDQCNSSFEFVEPVSACTSSFTAVTVLADESNFCETSFDDYNSIVLVDFSASDAVDVQLLEVSDEELAIRITPLPGSLPPSISVKLDFCGVKPNGQAECFETYAIVRISKGCDRPYNPTLNQQKQSNDKGRLVNSGLVLAPNPVQSEALLLSENEIEMIRVVDVSGKIAFEGHYNAGNQALLNLGHLNDGLYFLIVVSNEKKVSQIRFVKL